MSQSWFEGKKEYTKELVAIFLSMALCKKEMQISTKVLSQGLSGMKNMGKKNKENQTRWTHLDV